MCSNMTTELCTWTRGGAYDHTISSTFQVLNATDGGLGTDSSSADGGINAIALGRDNSPQATYVVPGGWDIYEPSSTGLPQSALGLGRQSAFVEAMYSNFLIASRTWSLFWGLQGATPDQQMDGSLVLGGYDVAKTIGPNMTQSFSSFADQVACPTSLVVDVIDVRLDFQNGTTSSLVSSVSPGFTPGYRACIRPDVPLVTFPSDVWTAFATAITGSYIQPSNASSNIWGLDFLASGVFDGNLTYVFSSGLQITIPNEQLVVPHISVNDAGKTFIDDDALREMLVYADPVYAPDMPLMGQVFMTSAYLHVNNDLQEFTLWQANPTKETSLVTVGTRCNATSTPLTTASPTPSPAPTLTSPQIVGVAIGGAAVIALSTLCGYWFLRKRSIRKDLERAKDAPSSEDMSMNLFFKAELTGSTPKLAPTVLKGELDGSARKPLPELYGGKHASHDYRDVKGPIELPVERYHELSG